MINRAEQLVTVFGGGGFIGRYVCEFLLRRGVRVRVASRDPRSAYFIQPLGQVGQIGYVQADITRRDTVEHALDGASGTVKRRAQHGEAADDSIRRSGLARLSSDPPARTRAPARRPPGH